MKRMFFGFLFLWLFSFCASNKAGFSSQENILPPAQNFKQIGGQFFDKENKIVYTLTGEKKWEPDMVSGEDTPPAFFINSNADTVSYAKAIWKNPLPVNGNTIDFIFNASTQTWQPKNGLLKVTDFGAMNDSSLVIHSSGWSINDTAFHKYVKWCTLNKQDIIIPAGKYIVNVQRPVKPDDTNSYYVSGDVFKPTYKKDAPLIEIFKMSGINIIFESGAEIHINGNTYHGSFTESGMPINVDGKNIGNFNYSTRTGHGAIISIVESNKINIINARVDGHRDKYILGGTFYDHLEFLGDGIDVLNSYDVKVQDFNIKNMGLDAIWVFNADYNRSSNIKFQNGYAGYSNRNNISWTGGNGLTIENCVIEKAGYGANWFSFPAANMDIEVECYTKNCSSKALNGIFDNVEFTQSRSTSISLSNYLGGSYHHSFNNCTLQGSRGYAGYVSAKNVNFKNCKIYSPFSPVDHTQHHKYEERTLFSACTFSDTIFRGDTMYYNSVYTDYILSNTTDFCEYTNCNVYNYYNSPININDAFHSGIRLENVNVYWYATKFAGINKYRGSFTNCALKNVKYITVPKMNGQLIYINNDNTIDEGGNVSSQLYFENNSSDVSGRVNTVNSKSIMRSLKKMPPDNLKKE